MKNIELLDVNLLDGYLDSLGHDIVQQMLDLYAQQSKTYIEEITDAIEQESQELWQERCHKMKGATGSVGLLEAHAKLVAIEKLPEQWLAKSTHMSELFDINQEAVAAVQAWLVSK